ncbi:MAG: hypothetical protein WA496_07200 [Candidatus Udaeobacter sp.]
MAKRCPYCSRAYCADRGAHSLESGGPSLIKPGEHRLVRPWRSRGRRIGKRTIVTTQAGGTETVKRGRRARKEACRSDSEQRNRIALADPEADTNSRFHAQAGCDGHTKTEGNAKTNPETNFQENAGGESFDEPLVESQVELDENEREVSEK